MGKMYQDLQKKDIYTKLAPLLEAGAFRINENGLLTNDFNIHAKPPWVYVSQHPDKDCGLWHKVMFDIYGLLPRKCVECWKVVVRPNTLSQLMKLLRAQRESGMYCKCGIENRLSVSAPYGGYFYNNSLEEGLDCLDNVRLLTSEHVGDDVDVFLKRGCTEFEHRFGDSKDWNSDVSLDQHILEREITTWFDRSNHTKGTVQPQWVQDNVVKGWIEHAYSIGDETYADFTDGMPLSPPYRTYEREVSK